MYVCDDIVILSVTVLVVILFIAVKDERTALGGGNGSFKFTTVKIAWLKCPD